MEKKLTLSTTNRKFGGICGGLGEYMDVDPTAIRVLWVLFFFLSFGTALIAYLACWLIIPMGPKRID